MTQSHNANSIWFNPLWVTLVVRPCSKWIRPLRRTCWAPFYLSLELLDWRTTLHRREKVSVMGYQVPKLRLSFLRATSLAAVLTRTSWWPQRTWELALQSRPPASTTRHFQPRGSTIRSNYRMRVLKASIPWLCRPRMRRAPSLLRVKSTLCLLIWRPERTTCCSEHWVGNAHQSRDSLTTNTHRWWLLALSIYQIDCLTRDLAVPQDMDTVSNYQDRGQAKEQSGPLITDWRLQCWSTSTITMVVHLPLSQSVRREVDPAKLRLRALHLGVWSIITLLRLSRKYHHLVLLNPYTFKLLRK